MPNEIRYLSPYIKSGNPDVYNEPTLYAPGDLGASWDANDRTYAVVQCDSGATSATPTGAVAANQLAFWKSKTNRIVTNDARVAIGGSTTNSGFRNEVAGVFRGSITAGNYTMILCRGHNVPLKNTGTTAAVGDVVVAATGTGADTAIVAAGTAVTVNEIGIARSAGTGVFVNADIDIPVLS